MLMLRKPMLMNRKIIIRLIYFLIILWMMVLLSGCAGLQGSSPQKNPDNSTANNGMTTAEVKAGNIGTIISGSGTFVPTKLTSLYFNDVSGPLKKLYVKANDNIKAGDPVAEIDPQNISNQISNQNMTMQQWTIRKLQNSESVLMADRNVKIAQMDLDQATKLNNQNPTDDNSENLAKQKILYDQAVSADKNAKWNQAMANLQYKLDQNTLNDLNTKLTNCILKSPVDGIVTFVENLSEPEMVNSGRVIARIAEPKNIVLQMLTTDSSYIQNVKNGVLTIGSVKYNVELYTPQPGDLLNQTSSNSQVNNRIYIRFIDKMPNITLDSVVNASLELKKSNVLIVPKAAVREMNGKTVVDVYKGSLVDTVNVVRGMEQNGNVEIISGLEAGQKVVLQ